MRPAERIRAALVGRRLPAVRDRGSWALSAATALTVLIAAGSLAPLLVTVSWWWACAFVVALVIFIPAAVRSWRTPRVVAGITGAVVLPITITLIFAPATTYFLLPTGDSVAALRDLVQAGTGSIYRQSIPATVEPGILFLIVSGVGALAVLADFIVFTIRAPAFAGLLLIPVLATPSFLQGSRVDPIAFALTAASFFLLLRVDVLRRPLERPSRRSSAVHSRRPKGAWIATAGIAAISIVGASAVAAVVPGYDRGPLAPTTGNATIFSGAINPVVSLGNDLRRPRATTALTYSTASELPQYLRVVTLDRFTGENWSPTLRNPDTTLTVDEIGPVPGLSAGVDRTVRTTNVVINNVASRWLPLPYPTESLDIPQSTWYWDPVDLSVSGDQQTTYGLSYTATWLELEPAAAQIATAGAPEGFDAYTELPGDLPGIISETARAVTADATSPYAQAIDLQEYLRSNEFTYSIDAPVENGYDGDGMAVVATFLTEKSGYCIHFSSAMAVMARSLGIPARLAVGYQPGTSVRGDTGAIISYSVSSTDLHSWPELYFPGIGWLPFEPTPGRGAPADYSLPSALAPTGSSDAPTAAATPDATPAPTSSAGRPLDGLDGDPTTAADTSASAWPAILVATGLLVALLIPAGVRRLQRWQRQVRLAGPDGPAVAWREVLATAQDLGAPVAETDTPRAAAALLSSQPGMGDTQRAAIDRLRADVESHWFGAPADAADATGVAVAARRQRADDVRCALAGLAAGAGPVARIRAVLVPMSLIPRRASPGIAS